MPKRSGHDENCQLRRLEEEFDRVDDGAELEEYVKYLQDYARNSGMVPNNLGKFRYCTCCKESA